MNPEALLSLISNLYAQLAATQEENAKLKQQLELASKED